MQMLKFVEMKRSMRLYSERFLEHGDEKTSVYYYLLSATLSNTYEPSRRSAENQIQTNMKQSIELKDQKKTDCFFKIMHIYFEYLQFLVNFWYL